jgi:hypothetical protein
VSNKRKTVLRTLQAEIGWSYQACMNLLAKHGGDYDKAVADAKSQPPREREEMT